MQEENYGTETESDSQAYSGLVELLEDQLEELSIKCQKQSFLLYQSLQVMLALFHHIQPSLTELPKVQEMIKELEETFGSSEWDLKYGQN